MSPQIVQPTKSVRHGGSGTTKWVQLDQLAWVIDTPYVIDDRRSNTGLYTCIADHTSNADNEPGVGDNWGSYWELSEPMRAKDVAFDSSTWTMTGDYFDVYRYPQTQIYSNENKIVVAKSGGYWVALANLSIEDIEAIVKDLFFACGE